MTRDQKIAIRDALYLKGRSIGLTDEEIKTRNQVSRSILRELKENDPKTYAIYLKHSNARKFEPQLRGRCLESVE